ncbi:MAG: FtsH protease activity modulator HflK [Myxococcales bacterium]|nr:FtsH protease activity modulator HflK [Myxococcales bacterium]
MTNSPDFDAPEPPKIFNHLKNKNGADNISKSSIGKVIVAVLIAFLAFESYYQIEPDEVGIIQRLGRYVETTDPGPHFRIPIIEEVTKVPVQRQMKMEFGFRTESQGMRTTYSANSAALQRESLMLTGDLNVAVVEWIVQYKIKNPYQYLFKVRNVDDTLRVLSETSMRRVVGDHSVNEVLTTGRQKIADEAKLQLQSLADKYDCGVDIQQLVLQDVNPPDPVKPSFNEVNQAIQEKERVINEAQAEKNKEIPRARGEAEQLISAAEGFAIERVNNAQGDASRFTAVFEAYEKAPAITRKRMYLETMAKVLPQAGTKIVVDENSKGMTPIVQLDGERLPAPRRAAVAQGGAQ